MGQEILSGPSSRRQTLLELQLEEFVESARNRKNGHLTRHGARVSPTLVRPNKEKQLAIVAIPLKKHGIKAIAAKIENGGIKITTFYLRRTDEGNLIQFRVFKGGKQS